MLQFAHSSGLEEHLGGLVMAFNPPSPLDPLDPKRIPLDPKRSFGTSQSGMMIGPGNPVVRFLWRQVA